MPHVVVCFSYTDQDALALEIDIGDGELAGERHFRKCGI
jgi:hypothetical protein